MADSGKAAGSAGIPPVSISSTSTRVTHTGSWKYIRPEYHDRVAPCNQGCPVGIDIEGYMNLLREDRVDEARELLERENPMPAVTGRVCDHPCETSCNRRLFDEPVAIHSVERMLGDLALEAPLPARPLPRSEKVAVVGSGPAGLACGYHLARLGYGVTVFESAPEAGGMLRLGIPEYRLPRSVLDRQVDRIRGHGVEIRCGVVVGEDVSWTELSVYDALFLASGAHVGRDAGMTGEDTPGVRSGLEFLKEVNAGGAPDVGERVVVVGGGNTAMDCARTALRLGADVLVLYRRTRAEMPAITEEVREAEREGVAFEFLAAPKAAHSDGDRLRGLECMRMRLGPPDDSGRRRPVPTDEAPFSVLADTVLTAIGEDPDLDHLPGGVEATGWGVIVDELAGTNLPLVFAGGDLAGETRTVAHAIGSGKRAALGIHRYLRTKAGDAVGEVRVERHRFGPEGNLSVTSWLGNDPVPRISPTNEVVTFDDMNPSHFRPAPRTEDRFLTADESRTSFEEVNRGMTRTDALEEARRCMNCGVCNECELCLIFCPDAAVSPSPDGWGFVVDMDYCKGCGLCAAECPRGVIVMTREGL